MRLDVPAILGSEPPVVGDAVARVLVQGEEEHLVLRIWPGLAPHGLGHGLGVVISGRDEPGVARDLKVALGGRHRLLRGRRRVVRVGLAGDAERGLLGLAGGREVFEQQ